MLDVEHDRTPGNNPGFTVTLFNAVGANLVVAAADRAILNSDSEIGTSAAQADLAEGNAGGTPFTFTLSRSGAIDRAASVGGEVVGIGGQTVSGDRLTAFDEQFGVRPINPGSGVSIDPLAASATGTIRTDDLGVTLPALDVFLDEGATGDQKAAATIGWKAARNATLDGLAGRGWATRTRRW